MFGALALAVTARRVTGCRRCCGTDRAGLLGQDDLVVAEPERHDDAGHDAHAERHREDFQRGTDMDTSGVSPTRLDPSGYNPVEC